MKRLGRGWQYSVYQSENNRVIKKRNSRLVAYIEMLKSCFPYKEHPIWNFPKYYISGTKEAVGSLIKIKNSSLDKKYFGNPLIFENGIDYEQDKAIPLHIHLKNSSVAEGMKTIDKFAEFNKVLIENCLIDKSFAIGKNFGLNEDGEVILIDIGELWSSPENIKRQIENKAWSKKYVLQAIPKNLHSYFLEKMNTLQVIQ